METGRHGQLACVCRFERHVRGCLKAFRDGIRPKGWEASTPFQVRQGNVWWIDTNSLVVVDKWIGTGPFRATAPRSGCRWRPSDRLEGATSTRPTGERFQQHESTEIGG